MYKIMIVEDDTTIAAAVKEHLCNWNYDVIYVENFKNIIEQFIAFDPQLVLLDVVWYSSKASCASWLSGKTRSCTC